MSDMDQVKITMRTDTYANRRYVCLCDSRQVIAFRDFVFNFLKSVLVSFADICVILILVPSSFSSLIFKKYFHTINISLILQIS